MCSSRSVTSTASTLTTYERRLSGPTDDLSQAGNPGSFLVPSLPGNPAYRSVWTAAFDSNRNGVADFVEPTLGLPAVPGAQPPVFADQNCTAIAAQDPKVVPAHRRRRVPSPIGAIHIGLCAFDFGGFYSIVPEGDAQQRVRRGHGTSSANAGRPPRSAHRRQRGARATTRRRSRSRRSRRSRRAIPTIRTAATCVSSAASSAPAAVPIESIHDSDTLALRGVADRQHRQHLGVGGRRAVQRERLLRLGARRARRPLQPRDPRLRRRRAATPTTGTARRRAVRLLQSVRQRAHGHGHAQQRRSCSNYLVGFESFDAHSELASLEGFVTRELGELGGGPVGIAIGAQYRGDELSYDYDENANRDNFLFLVGNPDFGDDRDIDAVFVELALPFSETLNLQFAGALRRLRRRRRLDGPEGHAALAAVAEVLAARLGGHVVPRAVAVPGVRHADDARRAHRPQRRLPQFFPVRTQPNPSGAALQPEEADVFNVGVSFVADRGLGIGRRLLVVRLHERDHRAERAGAS